MFDWINITLDIAIIAVVVTGGVKSVIWHGDGARAIRRATLRGAAFVMVIGTISAVLVRQDLALCLFGTRTVGSSRELKRLPRYAHFSWCVVEVSFTDGDGMQRSGTRHILCEAEAISVADGKVAVWYDARRPDSSCSMPEILTDAFEATFWTSVIAAFCSFGMFRLKRRQASST